MRSPLRALCLVLLPIALASPGLADIVWVGAVSDDIFDEANWDLSGSSVAVVDPNVTIADNVVIADAPAPVDVFVAGSQARFQVGDAFVITVSNSTVFTSGDDGLGGAGGSGLGPVIEVRNGGDVATFFIVNGAHMDLDSTSSAHLAGGATPINGATIDLTLGARLVCTDEVPADFINEHLSKVSVDGLSAVLNGNVSVVPEGALGSLTEALPVALGTGFCFGDGSGQGCPCGNTGVSGNGCGNGSFGAGAHLAAFGGPSSVALELTQVPAGQPALFFQGNNAVQGGAGALFGDGLRCAGGSVLRLDVQAADASGRALMGGVVQDHGGGAGPGETRRYQGWYRDPVGSPCGALFNLSNGVSIDY